MAKKKKAPEAKAPLRGLQDTPTNTNSYIVHDPDHELAMLVTDGAVDKVLLDGEELGGGGGGFPTITVSIEGEPLADFALTISGLRNDNVVYALYYDDPDYSTGYCMMMPGTSVEFLVLTDNLSLIGNSIGSATVTTSGDVEYIGGEEPYYAITGSCKFIVS